MDGRCSDRGAARASDPVGEKKKGGARLVGQPNGSWAHITRMRLICADRHELRRSYGGHGHAGLDWTGLGRTEVGSADVHRRRRGTVERRHGSGQTDGPRAEEGRGGKGREGKEAGAHLPEIPRT